MSDQPAAGSCPRAWRRPDPLSYAIIALAGPVAEARFTGTSLAELCCDIARVDLEMAREALQRLPDPPRMAEIVGRARWLVAQQ